MDAIIYALKEEKKQADRLLAGYQKELKKLPRGSFFIRTRGQKKYGYLTYSNQGKIIQNYLGVFEKEKIEEYQTMIKRKKKLKELIHQTQKQKLFIEKSLKYARKKS